jgi:hypothetical protein
VWVGRTEDGTAAVSIMDATGRKRISVQVAADGAAHLSFFDANGKVITEIPAPANVRE